jgi:ubiquitin C-terminal hydrolase
MVRRDVTRDLLQKSIDVLAPGLEDRGGPPNCGADAGEAICFVLNRVHEDLNRGDRGTWDQVHDAERDWDTWTALNQSDIATLFYGQTEQHVACDKCGDERTYFDTVNMLRLPLRPGQRKSVSLTGLLVLKDDWPHTCPVAPHQTSSHEEPCYYPLASFRFHRLPQVLIVDLPRVQYDCGKRVKIDTPVDFETELDMGPWSTLGDQGTSCVYHLHAVLEHSGGVDDPLAHYIAYIRRGDEWLLFNDLQVQRVTMFEVRAARACFLFYVAQSDDVLPDAE